MCGIFGLIAKEDISVDQAIVERATNRLVHRGPDDEGYFFIENIGLGNRRLAIRDLSKEATMPMRREHCTITYNGEIYNTAELKAELEALGHIFKTQSDTEIILTAYLEWGIACQEKLSGMWAFIIYDDQLQSLFCSRDRFGIKPFFIWENEKQIAFASEIKAFQELPDWKPILNQQLAADFIFKGMQHHSIDSLFKNVQQLPAGHFLNINIKKPIIELKVYYNIANHVQAINFDKKRGAQKLYELLAKSVKNHLLSDVPVGTALSGGLDSSSILSLRKELEPSLELEAVSYFAEDPVVNEKEYVDKMAEETNARIYPVEFPFDEAIEHLDQVIQAHDEPLLSGSLLAQWAVFREAKKSGLKVMLDGQGADEILGGYATFYRPLLKEQLWSAPIALIQNLIGIYKTNKNVINRARTVPDNYKRFFKLPTSSTIVYPKGFTNYSIYLLTKGILPYLLHFEDRNSMAHSVESRVPFLDRQVVEFCLNMPSALKIEKGIRKKVLREAMADLLPDKILNRTDKIGFVSAQNQWMHQNADWVLQEIGNTVENSPELFVDESIKDFAREVMEQKNQVHYAFLWRLICFGRWMELYGVERP